MSVPMTHLEKLYASSVDPWNYRTSEYEKAKFLATRDALSCPLYAAALEIGCGNGELSKYLAPLCETYIGLDAISKALEEARRIVPQATFIQGYFPCDLPVKQFDLIILSEILYFFDARTIGILGEAISLRWPGAEILCVNYLGSSGNELEGATAFQRFKERVADTHYFESVDGSQNYRIDRGLPLKD